MRRISANSSDSARNDPIWAAILKDPLHPFPNDVTILEGHVMSPKEKFQSRVLLPQEAATDQAPSEVAEEDLPWNHFTHDKTIDVVPDPGYRHLLAQFLRADGTTGVYESMEVEWENASNAAEVINDNVTPSVDSVWAGCQRLRGRRPATGCGLRDDGFSIVVIRDRETRRGWRTVRKSIRRG